MDIVVCIKQVPEVERVRIDPETNTLMREGVPSMINPFDRYALEAALQIRDRHSARIKVITMGPPQAEEILRQAYAIGVDEAYLITGKEFAGADTLATSYTLATGIKKMGGFDLVICGRQAIDGDTAQVGPELAELLGIPQVTYVKKIDLYNSLLRVECELEEGYEMIEVPLPALLTVTRWIGEMRSPTLRGVLAAKNKDITRWGVEDLALSNEEIGLSGSPTRVVRLFTPPLREGREIFEGEPREVVVRLVERIKEVLI
jgi:electron transfer flavoprotein beta subunit